MNDDGYYWTVELEELWLKEQAKIELNKDDNKGSSVTLNDRIIKEKENGINSK